MVILILEESIFPPGGDGDPGGDVVEQPKNGAEKTDAKAPSFGVDGRSWCSAKGALRHQAEREYQKVNIDFSAVDNELEMS